MSKDARMAWSVVVFALAVPTPALLLGTRAAFSAATILVICVSAFYTLRSMMDVKEWTLRTAFARYVALVGLLLALVGAIGYATGTGEGGIGFAKLLPFFKVSELVDVDQILNLSSILLAVSASMVATGDNSRG